MFRMPRVAEDRLGVRLAVRCAKRCRATSEGEVRAGSTPSFHDSTATPPGGAGGGAALRERLRWLGSSRIDFRFIQFVGWGDVGRSRRAEAFFAHVRDEAVYETGPRRDPWHFWRP
jgi:hypothetical protein